MTESKNKQFGGIGRPVALGIMPGCQSKGPDFDSR